MIDPQLTRIFQEGDISPGDILAAVEVDISPADRSGSPFTSASNEFGEVASLPDLHFGNDVAENDRASVPQMRNSDVQSLRNDARFAEQMSSFIGTGSEPSDRLHEKGNRSLRHDGRGEADVAAFHELLAGMKSTLQAQAELNERISKEVSQEITAKLDSCNVDRSAMIRTDESPGSDFESRLANSYRDQQAANQRKRLET